MAFKDCERDPAFRWIVAVLTIQAAAEEYGVRTLILVGAPKEVAAVLSGIFVVEEIDSCRSPHALWVWGRAVASRILYAVQLLRRLGAVRRWVQLPRNTFGVVLSAFWDWSVRRDDQTLSLDDRYFKRLPEELKEQNLSQIGWFAWFDPDVEPGKQGRKLKDILAPLNGRQDVVILQGLLCPWDILRAVTDVRPLAKFLRVRNQPVFKEAFVDRGVDYFPLFAAQLLRGFLDASVPHYNLVALATERAVRHYRPKMTISFLEHFPYARAHYEGVRRGKTGAVCCAVQHASYNHEKTYLFLHPSLEYNGEPDGCAVPHPDYVCAMGTLGYDLFLECGYPKERVWLTGSPRYDHVSSTPAPLGPRRGEKGTSHDVHLLMVSTLNIDLELEMVDALCSAVQGLDGFRLFLRNHPFSAIEQHPKFAQYKGQVQLTCERLEEDLAQADLIVFTYSVVAEEAFLLRKPVWQWLSSDFNGSALAEVVGIPQFSTVASLREALQRFRADPSPFLPDDEAREHAFDQLFYRGDRQASHRIAEKVGELVQRAAPA